MVNAKSPHSGDFDTHFNKETDQITSEGILTVNDRYIKEAKFPDFLPTWDPSQKYKPLKFFKHEDPGARADPSFPNLFPKDSEHQTKRVTPKLGSEVRGIQISELNDQGKDELALLVAERGVVIFRDQNFAEKGPQFAVEFGKHFGRLHIHPTSGAPLNHPELHITYRRADPTEFDRVFSQRTSAISWHSDVSYELQPPGTTFFSVLDGPDAGGDTIFADTEEAYNRLSPEFQKRLQGLHVLHSSEQQALNSRDQGGIERRTPVSNVHPLIRTHPVTGRKNIFLNRPFARRIVELKEEESDYLLSFLYSHIELSHDLQLRASWEPRSVVIWDNRRVVHSAVIDWDTPVSRHAFRITPQAERPVEDLADLNKYEVDAGDVLEAFEKLGQ
ncbi:taurine dioxygenase/sulfonate dioxygenase [Metschnikowia aff. pulcherrima]|uniref:Taurine dioxygenase/sulfonate dioxygenase n=2 Tax=Metschnikowia TaxID=27320 RepID=A0A4P6XL08_9ASCO|nr:hypothetical protein HF325_003554 [Metschnikowia pulcherrima]QBM86846.1 taurine dioxygenase/sulfonate dioxygenase [Metschnikowia aff. pulcherrima]